MDKKLKKIGLLLLVVFILVTGCGKTSELKPKLGVLSGFGSTEDEKADIIHELMLSKAYPGEEDTLPDYEVMYFEDFNTMLLSLDRGDIDAIYMTKSLWRYINELFPDKYTPPENTSNIAFSIALLEENKDLCDEISRAIDELKENGTLDLLKIDYIDYYGSRNIENTYKLPYFEGAKTINVAITGDLPPMDYVSTTGVPCGYNVALLSEIANILKVNFEIVSTNAGSRTIMLTSKKADLIFWCSGYENINDEGYIYTSDVPEGVLVTSPYFVDQISDVKLK